MYFGSFHIIINSSMLFILTLLNCRIKPQALCRTLMHICSASFDYLLLPFIISPSTSFIKNNLHEPHARIAVLLVNKYQWSHGKVGSESRIYVPSMNPFLQYANRKSDSMGHCKLCGFNSWIPYWLHLH